MRQGAPIGNLPAVQTCNERGWSIGTKLHSKKWSGARVIRAVENKFVRLSMVQGHHNTTRVLTFPPDVTTAE